MTVDEKDKYRKELKELFSSILEENNMSQTQLAKVIGVKQQTINEKINNASWRYIDVLAVLDKLNYNISYHKK